MGERQDLNVSGERIDLREGSEPVDLAQRETSYRDVLRRVVERYAGNENVALNIDPALVEQFETEYAELRQGLRGTYDRPIASEMPVADEEEPDAATESPAPTDAPLIPSHDGEDEEEVDSAAEGPIPNRSKLPQIDQLAAALRHGQRIDQLAPGDETRFNELVAQAEDALKKGEFFLAERRFDRALRFNPGNPLATAGMGHAQVGSGLYLSAALTLRNLLTNNPEMIDVRYDESLVPARGRLESAITTIRQRLEKKQDYALNAFLLAYIGKLLDDRSLMKEGLDTLARALPGDPLEQLLRAVWLSDAPRPVQGDSNRPQPADNPQK